MYRDLRSIDAFSSIRQSPPVKSAGFFVVQAAPILPAEWQSQTMQAAYFAFSWLAMPIAL
jgi:hypothetical protein